MNQDMINKSSKSLEIKSCRDCRHANTKHYWCAYNGCRLHIQEYWYAKEDIIPVWCPLPDFKEK
jgi:hypothetical protein